jgi:hypothetical protein
MKITLPTLIAVVAVAGVASTAPADTMQGHTIVSPQEIKLGPAQPCSRLGRKRRSYSAIRARKAYLCSGSSCPRAIVSLRIRIRSMRSSR